VISPSPANVKAKFADVCVGVEDAGERPSVLRVGFQIPYGHGRVWEKSPELGTGLE
jgi:hypothetical protein